jgi:uncharacterized membrane protein YgcG
VMAAARDNPPTLLQRAGAHVASLGMAATLLCGAPALAGEFDIINTPAPKSGVVDDAGVLSKASQGTLLKAVAAIKAQTGKQRLPRRPSTNSSDQARRLQWVVCPSLLTRNVWVCVAGYQLEVVTVRKLVFEADPFAFADQVIENWFPTVEEGDKVGVLLLTTTSKEGALVGGPSFMKAVGPAIVEGIVTENIPIFTEEEKYNEAILSSVSRIQSALTGKEDPGGPVRSEKAKGGNFKTKEETKAQRNKFAGVVIGLLVIATAVPMIQYYGYVGGK